MHVPKLHVEPVGQTLPQLPQLNASVVVSTQPTPSQYVPWLGQTHDPDWQACPTWQALPQLPQLDVSLDVSTHPVPGQ